MEYMKLNGCYRPLPDEKSFSTGFDIIKIGADVFSKQITLIELSLFKAIKREEFISMKWNGKEKHQCAPNIVASTRWFNQLNFWVQKEILRYPQATKRSEMLSFFIKLAKKLVEHNNLYSAMAIISALQVECIYRLRHTWDGLNNKDRAAYRRLEDLFSQENNCQRQREHMNSITLPGIPYLGVYLSDLTYTNLAHPRICGKPSTLWHSKINAIIDNIAYFQQSEYPFTVDETVNAYLCAQRYIEELQKFIEEDNYRTSLCLEPPPQSPAEPANPLYSSEKRGSVKHSRDKSLDRFLHASPASHFKSPFRNSSARKHQKFSVDNTSFEFDTVSKSNLFTNAAQLKPASSTCSVGVSTPITRSKHPQHEPDTTDCMVRYARIDSLDTLFQNKQSDFEPANSVVPRKLSDTSYNNSDNAATQLPPIPPRPGTESNTRHRKNLSNASCCQMVDDGNTQNTSLLGFPPKHELDCSLQSNGCAAGNSTMKCRETLTDTTMAAVGGAIAAKELSDAVLFDRNGNEKCAPATAAVSLTSGTTSRVSGHQRSASIPATMPLTMRPSPLPCQLGVVVLFQGALERRTLTNLSASKPPLLLALLSPRLRKGSYIRRDSASSLSTSSVPSEQTKTSLTLARPAGFSTWRRLWVSLVVVGAGSAAFMLYFEATGKNAVLRCQFRAHQCQVHRLTTQTPSSSSPLVNSSNGIASSTPAHHAKSAAATIVDVARHRDGTINPHSFVVSDSSRGKLYQFRLIDQPNPRRSSLNWFRRNTIVHMPRAETRATEPDLLDSSAEHSQRTAMSTSLMSPMSRTDGVNNPEIAQWIHSIRVAIGQVKNHCGQ